MVVTVWDDENCQMMSYRCKGFAGIVLDPADNPSIDGRFVTAGTFEHHRHMNLIGRLIGHLIKLSGSTERERCELTQDLWEGVRKPEDIVITGGNRRYNRTYLSHIR